MDMAPDGGAKPGGEHGKPFVKFSGITIKMGKVCGELFLCISGSETGDNRSLNISLGGDGGGEALRMGGRDNGV